MKKKIVLSIALLVSNRKDTIRKCLDSLTPIREAIPSELIIIDTGCDEDVRNILKEYADILETFTWCNDFSAARNETLKYAHGEWYLYLDDDEWFVDTKELIEFFQSGEYKQYGYASYIQRNYLDMQASQYTDSWVSRMTKLTSNTHFESKIHEYLVPMEGNIKGLHAVVDHFGYVFETQEALWKHYERNRVLLEEMIKEEPENLRWYIQLAQEYRTVQEWRKLYDLSEHCLNMVRSQSDMYTNIFLGAFYAGKIIALKEWGKLEEGFAVCKEALKDKRNVELFQAFAQLRMAGFCYWLGKYEEALEHILSYLKWQTFFAENEPLLFLQKSAPFIADSFDVVMQKEIYSIWMCIGLWRGDTSYLRKYFSKLEWDGHHLYVFEDIVQALIFAMNQQNMDLKNESNIFEKFEDKVANINFESLFFKEGREKKHQKDEMSDYLIYKTVLQTMYNHSALWEYFCQELCKVEEQGQNVHTIMELIRNVLPEAVASEEERKDYGESNQVNLSEKKLSEVNCSKNQVENVGSQEEIIQNDEKQENSVQIEEMKQLAEQIKGQIRLLMQNGMENEAKSVIAQLKKMLPDDVELEEMERNIV